MGHCPTPAVGHVARPTLTPLLRHQVDSCNPLAPSRGAREGPGMPRHDRRAYPAATPQVKSDQKGPRTPVGADELLLTEVTAMARITMTTNSAVRPRAI